MYEDPEPISSWFGLSYARFLTVPRLVMKNMPLEWQRKMAKLLYEMDKTFDWRPSEGRYWVRLRDDRGRFSPASLGDYRHGSVEHLRLNRFNYCPYCGESREDALMHVCNSEKAIPTGDSFCHRCGVAVIYGPFCCKCGAPNGV